MTEEQQHDIDVGRPRDRIDIFLDGAAEPLLSTTPPLSFELDTSLMEDGPHVMRIEAYDTLGVRGTRTIDFSVRNGPGIAVAGIRQHDVLDGKIPVIVNAYGGTTAVNWEPSQAETPAPAPTWAWVLLIVVVAFGIFYGVQQWSPTGEFARDPNIRNVRRLPESGRSGGRRRSARTCCRGRARRHHAAGFDRAVGGPGACGRRAWRGTLLRQLRRLPPELWTRPPWRVPAVSWRSRRSSARSDRTHHHRPQRQTRFDHRRGQIRLTRCRLSRKS